MNNLAATLRAHGDLVGADARQAAVAALALYLSWRTARRSLRLAEFGTRAQIGAVLTITGGLGLLSRGLDDSTITFTIWNIGPAPLRT